MLEATIHGYRATYDAKDGWRCAEALTEKFLRRNCTPDVEPDPTHVNVERRKELDLSAPGPEERAMLIAAHEFPGAFELAQPNEPVAEDQPDTEYRPQSEHPKYGGGDDIPIVE